MPTTTTLTLTKTVPAGTVTPARAGIAGGGKGWSLKAKARHCRGPAAIRAASPQPERPRPTTEGLEPIWWDDDPEEAPVAAPQDDTEALWAALPSAANGCRHVKGLLPFYDGEAALTGAWRPDKAPASLTCQSEACRRQAAAGQRKETSRKAKPRRAVHTVPPTVPLFVRVRHPMWAVAAGM